jgi:hypothetical protein
MYLYPNDNYDINNSFDYDTLIWRSNTNKPSKKELDDKWDNVKLIIKKESCKSKAKDLIANCDWSVLPDVKLQNKIDFENYRSQLRNYIINPVENPIFPNEPQPIWSV